MRSETPARVRRARVAAEHPQAEADHRAAEDDRQRRSPAPMASKTLIGNSLPNHVTRGMRVSSGSGSLTWLRLARPAAGASSSDSVAQRRAPSGWRRRCRAAAWSAPRARCASSAARRRSRPRCAPPTTPTSSDDDEHERARARRSGSPTYAAKHAPITSWPSWPMLTRPARPLTIVPSATSRIGADTPSVRPHAAAVTDAAVEHRRVHAGPRATGRGDEHRGQRRARRRCRST